MMMIQKIPSSSVSILIVVLCLFSDYTAHATESSYLRSGASSGSVGGGSSQNNNMIFKEYSSNSNNNNRKLYDYCKDAPSYGRRQGFTNYDSNCIFFQEEKCFEDLDNCDTFDFDRDYEECVNTSLLPSNDVMAKKICNFYFSIGCGEGDVGKTMLGCKSMMNHYRDEIGQYFPFAHPDLWYSLNDPNELELLLSSDLSEINVNIGLGYGQQFVWYPTEKIQYTNKRITLYCSTGHTNCIVDGTDFGNGFERSLFQGESDDDDSKIQITGFTFQNFINKHSNIITVLSSGRHDVIIDDCVFTNNGSIYGGTSSGAIFVAARDIYPNKAVLQITNSIFLENTGPIAGAVWIEECDATIINSTFEGNTGNSRSFPSTSAIFVADGSTLNLQGSTFKSNTSEHIIQEEDFSIRTDCDDTPNVFESPTSTPAIICM